MSFGFPEYDKLMDAYKCEICGDWFKGLGYHLKYHNISMDEYKKKFGFNRQQSFLSKESRELKKEIALSNGTASNITEAGKPYRFKKGTDKRRYYKRTPQTVYKLRVIKKLSFNKKKYG